MQQKSNFPWLKEILPQSISGKKRSKILKLLPYDLLPFWRLLK